MVVKSFYDSDTFTLSYLLFDSQTKDSVVIDPVLDYDPAASKINTKSMNRLLEEIRSLSLKVHFVLETHAHADHLSSAEWLAAELSDQDWRPKKGIGAKVTEVQKAFKEIYDFGLEFAVDGSQFDILFEDGDIVNAGSIQGKVISTPGHTPACVSYLFEDCLFTGDSLFMPDFGTGRCDFPGGDAEQLYESITRKIYSLDANTRVFVGHDYQPGGRELKFETSVEQSRTENKHLSFSTSKEEFVRFRTDRDKQLSAPRLLLPSIQFNVNAGKFLSASVNNRNYLKIPVFMS